MPSFAKSAPELVERFVTIAAEFHEAERRQMFGYPCLFVGGNMVTGLHASAWFVRLDEPNRAELLRLDDAGPFEPMPGRPMTGYSVLPASVIADDAAARRWVERAVAFGRTLPPKASKASTTPSKASKVKGTPP